MDDLGHLAIENQMKGKKMTVKNTWTSTASARHNQVKGEVTAFRIWQIANSLGWDCTIAECAKIAGIKYSTAQVAVARKGWAKKFNEEALMEARSNGRLKGGYKRQQNENSDLVDVCDLMERGAL